jgi:hypothetical protein
VRAPRVHIHEHFEFCVEAPLESAWPLFGAKREQDWAPGWHPRFVWPPVANDQQGMVFEIADGDETAIWVNTSLDPGANRIQYVYVIPNIVVTVITLKLRRSGSSTHVEVTYDRTALAEAADERVRHLAARDSMAGPEWSAQINQYLVSRP